MLVCFCLCLCVTKKVRSFWGWLLRSIILHCFPHVRSACLSIFVLFFYFLYKKKGPTFVRFGFYIFVSSSSLLSLFPMLNYDCCTGFICIHGWSVCLCILFFILLKQMFICLPHFWMDGCYYFLNLILLSCLSFIPLLKRPDLSTSSCSHVCFFKVAVISWT